MLEIKRIIGCAEVDAVKSIKPDAELDAAAVEGMLEYPPDAKMGDLALPCFKLSKLLRSAPVKIAAEISEKLSVDVIARAEAVNG